MCRTTTQLHAHHPCVTKVIVWRSLIGLLQSLTRDRLSNAQGAAIASPPSSTPTGEQSLADASTRIVPRSTERKAAERIGICYGTQTRILPLLWPVGYSPLYSWNKSIAARRSTRNGTARHRPSKTPTGHFPDGHSACSSHDLRYCNTSSFPKNGKSHTQPCEEHNTYVRCFAARTNRKWMQQRLPAYRCLALWVRLIYAR
jgi:hypothetical protein